MAKTENCKLIEQEIDFINQTGFNQISFLLRIEPEVKAMVSLVSLVAKVYLSISCQNLGCLFDLCLGMFVTGMTAVN